jgi:hypothetical protein
MTWLKGLPNSLIWPAHFARADGDRAAQPMAQPRPSTAPELMCCARSGVRDHLSGPWSLPRQPQRPAGVRSGCSRFSPDLPGRPKSSDRLSRRSSGISADPLRCCQNGEGVRVQRIRLDSLGRFGTTCQATVMDDRCWMQILAAVPHLEAPAAGQVAPASGHDPQDERRPLNLETFRLATDPGAD